MQSVAERIRLEMADGPTPTVLARVIADDRLHARLLNMLAGLKVIGLRKLLKSRDTSTLDLLALEHIRDEATQTARLKNAALQFAERAKISVERFEAAECLGGKAAERYFQSTAQACASVLPIAEPRSLEHAAFLLTCVVTEIRSDAFYPLYEQALIRSGLPFSLAAVLRERRARLPELMSELRSLVPEVDSSLEAALQAEQIAFDLWLAALDAEVRGWMPEPLFADFRN